MAQNQAFETVRVNLPPKNTFDLTHDFTTTARMGKLIPVMVEECVPGDQVRVEHDMYIRFQPMLAPPMHRFDATVHTFFVPLRILHNDPEDFESWLIGNSGAAPIPQVTRDGTWSALEDELADNMGVPPFVAPNAVTPQNINAFPFAAYQAIYNEWYRDQNMIAAVNYKVNGGVNARGDLCTMRYRAWEHDLFTSALPTAQAYTAVDIPLGEVYLENNWSTGGARPGFRDNALGPIDTTGSPVPFNQQVVAGETFMQADPAGVPGFTDVAWDPDGSLLVGPTTINSLRRAYALQRFYEALNRGGKRFYEALKNIWGAYPRDARLQRPEYITGSKNPVFISDVPNYGGDDATIPQGTLAGSGVVAGGGYNASYNVEEHGFLISILSILPKPAYQQGLRRFWTKTDYTDFYIPQLAHIGEQEVRQDEIFAFGPNPSLLFGYNRRYYDYTYSPNRVAGDIRTSLSMWKAQRIFTAAPTLSQQFIECNTESDGIEARIFAVGTSEDQLICHVVNKLIMRRSLPKYGTPI